MVDERHPRGTAYHEAGHAVVAWSFGLQVGTINIRADDAGGGAQIGPADHLSVVEQIAVCAAGYIAENEFGHHAPNRLAASRDLIRIRDILKAHAVEEGSRAEGLRSQSYDCALARLRANEPKVVRLAKRLVQNGSVNSAAFLSLMRD